MTDSSIAHNTRWICAATVLLCAAGASAQPAPVAGASAPGDRPASASALADPLFAQPYIDVDEWRDAPVRHRYVHGGFTGTETRFSFYFPPKAEYHGRFFQHITPVPDNENLAQQVPAGVENKIGFAIASGGYFVETNGGGKAHAGFGSTDPSIGAYRANAAAARFSRVVAIKMYGGKRPFGYAYGGSGGAYRTIGSFENTRGVWDGVVPYVLGSPMAIPNMLSVRMHAKRLLNGKFPQIVDAVEPGGSGDPYAGLSPEQADALREVTRMGFPTPSWFGWQTSPSATRDLSKWRVVSGIFPTALASSASRSGPSARASRSSSSCLSPVLASATASPVTIQPPVRRSRSRAFSYPSRSRPCATNFAPFPWRTRTNSVSKMPVSP